jgi:predicted RNase H-like HicB family nuclease
MDNIIWYYDCMEEVFVAYDEDGVMGSPFGYGNTAEEAIQNLKEMTSGKD